jgi:hypothetical protein
MQGVALYLSQVVMTQGPLGWESAQGTAAFPCKQHVQANVKKADGDSWITLGHEMEGEMRGKLYHVDRSIRTSPLLVHYA